MGIRWLVLCAALFLVCTDALGQQIDFGRSIQGGDELLRWRWRGNDGRDHRTSFALTRESVRQAESSFRDFSMEAMWRTLEDDLVDEVQKFGNGAQIKVTRNLDGLQWSISGPDQRSVDALSHRVAERLDRQQEAYLARYMRRRVGQRILIDYAAAARALQKAMVPVSRGLAAVPGIVDSDRARISLALGFFQQIPYVALEDRQRGGGDFLPAPALLAENRGDCDSKSVALAAVLLTSTPRRKLVMVTMPGHAILAAGLASQAEDWTVRFDGQQYVTLEAAGPAMAAVGQVGPLTARYLKEGRKIEIWPLN